MHEAEVASPHSFVSLEDDEDDDENQQFLEFIHQENNELDFVSNNDKMKGKRGRKIKYINSVCLECKELGRNPPKGGIWCYELASHKSNKRAAKYILCTDCNKMVSGPKYTRHITTCNTKGVVKNTNTSSDEEEVHNTLEPVKIVNITPANAEQRSNMSTPVGQYQFNSIFVPKPPLTKPTVQYQVQTGQDPKASFSFIMPSSFSLEKESQPVQFTPETTTFLQYPLSKPSTPQPIQQQTATIQQQKVVLPKTWHNYTFNKDIPSTQHTSSQPFQPFNENNGTEASSPLTTQPTKKRKHSRVSSSSSITMHESLQDPTAAAVPTEIREVASKQYINTDGGGDVYSLRLYNETRNEFVVLLSTLNKPVSMLCSSKKRKKLNQIIAPALAKFGVGAEELSNINDVRKMTKPRSSGTTVVYDTSSRSEDGPSSPLDSPMPLNDSMNFAFMNHHSNEGSTNDDVIEADKTRQHCNEPSTPSVVAPWLEVSTPRNGQSMINSFNILGTDDKEIIDKITSNNVSTL